MATVLADREEIAVLLLGTPDRHLGGMATLLDAPAEHHRDRTGSVSRRRLGSDFFSTLVIFDQRLVETRGKLAGCQCQLHGLLCLIQNDLLELELTIFFPWRYRIVAALGPGVATQDSGESHPAPSEYAKLLDSLVGVL